MDVTVAAWIGSANAGDALIFAALRRKLLARATHVTAITSAPAAASDGDVEWVDHRSPAAVARAIRGADALILGGGGLLQDHTSWFNLPYHLSKPLLARIVRTPRAAVGVGAGPLRTVAGRAQVRLALGGATPVSVRDERSAQVLRGAGIRDPRVAADLALSLPAPRTPVDDVICASLRPWHGAPGRLPVATRARTDITPAVMVRRLAAGLDDAAGLLGLPVRLVALQPGWDDLLHRRVAAEMHAPVTLAGPRSDEVPEMIAASRVVVAMRFHAGIAAVLAGRPAVLIGYDPKLESLANDMGKAARLLAWDPDDLGQLGTAVAEVSGRADGLPAVLAGLRTRERINDTVLDEVLGLGPVET